MWFAWSNWGTFCTISHVAPWYWIPIMQIDYCLLSHCFWLSSVPCLTSSVFGSVFMMYLWREMYSVSTYSSAILGPSRSHFLIPLSVFLDHFSNYGYSNPCFKIWGNSSKNGKKRKGISWPCKCQKIYLQPGNRQNWLPSVLSVRSLAWPTIKLGYFTTLLEQRLICKFCPVEIK